MTSQFLVQNVKKQLQEFQKLLIVGMTQEQCLLLNFHIRNKTKTYLKQATQPISFVKQLIKPVAGSTH